MHLCQACFGHTEGTAGITGALLALSAVGQRSAVPTVNLRHVNPYVEAALADWNARSSKAASVTRQLSPGTALQVRVALPLWLLLILLSDRQKLQSGQLAGTSSFGMSGVNSHLLLTVPSEPLHCGAAAMVLHVCPSLPCYCQYSFA